MAAMAAESVQRAEAAALPNLSNLSTAAAADAQTPIPELRLTRRYDDPAPPALTLILFKSQSIPDFSCTP